MLLMNYNYSHIDALYTEKNVHEKQACYLEQKFNTCLPARTLPVEKLRELQHADNEIP